MNYHQTPVCALLAIAHAAPIELPGLRLACVGVFPSEVWPQSGRRAESILFDREHREVQVLQHIRLKTGHTVTAPYLVARGVG